MKNLLKDSLFVILGLLVISVYYGTMALVVKYFIS